MALLLSDLPLPAGGAAVAEAGLLAQALMAASPSYAEIRFAAQQATADAGDGDVLHMILSRHGQVALDFFIERGSDGSGRYHEDVADDARARAVEMHVDVADLLTGRLGRLAGALAGSADEAYLTPVRNALQAAEATLSPAGTDPALAAAGDRLLQSCLAGSTQAQLVDVRAVIEEMTTRQLQWSLDGWSMGAILIAVNVPVACAATAADDAAGAVTFARYMAMAASAARSGDSLEVGVVVSRALADGHAASLATLSADLLAEAVRRRDAALAGPPSPMQFGGMLSQALPYALAGWWISRWADDEGAPAPGQGDDTWKKRRTDAEELFVRMTDGVVAQWMRFISGAVAEERRQIMAVAKEKGKLAANELLRKGEDSYHRPKSLRPYLLGERDTPDGS
jgi:hypothetical protein